MSLLIGTDFNDGIKGIGSKTALKLAKKGQLEEKIKVDKIVKNAKVFTSAARDFHATAFAVKDGKFVYVGDEEG